jgi:glycosyltransferase involved in cell wall biosynthesis
MGSIAKEDLPSVYKASDVVFLLSALESFSNNIIEAWTFKRFLIISDEEWSRSICDSAAIYVSRNDPSKIASELLGLIQEKRIRTKVEYAAEEALVSYPSIYERINAELQLIKSLVRKG